MNQEEDFKITVNGTSYKILASELTPATNLNSFLRTKLHLTGTKRMCLEGGCGVCIVVLKRKNFANRMKLQAVNSCLIPVFSCNGWEVQTVEGLVDNGGYHYLQKVLAYFNGTQCGFCSPGMVMNMFSLLENDKITMKEVENSFGGNICRCTGYRPILSAFKSVCKDASPELLCSDIEDFKPCPSICNQKCPKQQSFYFNLGSKTWIRPVKVHELWQILKTFHNSSYYLLCGNTSIGVYKPIREYEVYVDISNVPELVGWKIEKDFVIMGANTSLTDAMEMFQELSKHPQYKYMKGMAEHVDLIANVPVRNLGTIAGNLMIKYHHNEFYSDIFLIFETVEAMLWISDGNGYRAEMKLPDFLKCSMKGRLIEKVVFPPLPQNYVFESYKIMPRAQNAHALVNAGFLLQLNDNTVKSARIVYGCINPSFLHASKTEKFLINKKLFDDEVLQRCFEILESELKPDFTPPNPSSAFRKQLSISLFYKFVLSIAPEKNLSLRNKTGGNKIQRPLSSGIQDFETNSSVYPLTKAIPKIEALAQTSGQAEYIADMPNLPNQLFAAFVLAKAKPMSIISKIDASAALKIPGVVAFFDHSDIPGQNNFTPNLPVKEEIFCSGLVQYYYQPVGIIVARTSEIAEAASDFVEISYSSPKTKALLSIKEVLKSKDTNRIKLERKIDPVRKGTDISQVVKGSVELSWQYHFHMETQCCNVVPNEDGLDIYPSSQWIDLSQTAAATTLNIPANKINVFIRRLGGGFGAKLSRNSLVSCAAALAAFKLKKPVKIWMNLETNMNVIGKRYPVLCYYEVGVNNEGSIQYLESEFYSDYGVGGNEPNIPYIFDNFLAHYKIDSWSIKGFSVNSDNHASCYIRAPGTCEGLAMVEAIMEHVAMSLNVDPLELKLKNIDPEKTQIIEFIQELKDWANIDVRKQDIESFNKNNKWRKRGLSVVPMSFPLHFFGSYGVIVSIYQSDGSVSIAHGGVEMGQGINTKVVQVCAYKFGIPLDKISVKPSNSLVAPNSHMSGGSITSETVCNGVLQACDILLKRMEPIKKSLTEPSWETVVRKCYEEFINLSASSMPNPKDENLNNYTVYGVCSAEIELDVLTGQHIITRVDLLEDCGSSINPNIDIGQVEGAFVMGIGYFTTEEIIFDKHGQLLTNRTWNYKPPGFKDIPVDFRVKFPRHTGKAGILHSKATAEPPLCLASAIPFAIRQAVASVRAESGLAKNWYNLCGPSTVEDTFLNCLHDYKCYKL